MLHYQARTQNDSRANRQLLKTYKDSMLEVRQRGLKFSHRAAPADLEDNNDNDDNNEDDVVEK